MSASSLSPSPASSEAARPSPRRAWVEGVVLLVLVAIVGVLAAAGRVPAGDGAHLAALTMDVSDAVRAGELGRAATTWFTRVAPQPPAGFLPGIVATLLLGDRWLAMLLVGALALWLCWDAQKRLADGAIPWAPALVVVASPMVWLAVGQYGWDLLTAAAVLQCVAWLHRSDGLRADTPDGRRAAAWFGAWMGLGFLTKYTFPMFLWLPCLLAGLGIAAGPDRGVRLRGLGLAVLVFAAIVGPWLVVNGAALSAYLGRSVGEGAVAAVDATRAGDNRFSAEALSLYPLALKDALGWPGVFALGFAGIAGAAASWGGGAGPPRNAPPRAGENPGSTRRSRLSGPALAAAAALGGVLVLSSLEQSQDRYALPALVALAPLASSLARLPWGQEVFVGVFAVQLVGTLATFRPGAPTSEPRFDHGLATAAVVSWPFSRSYRPTHVDLAAWRVDEALNAAVSAAEGADPRAPTVLVLPDDPRLPEPGVYLMRARQLDLARELHVVRHRPDAPPREGWPGREAGAAYVVWAPGLDRATEAWLAGSGRERAATFALPGGRVGVVLR